MGLCMPDICLLKVALAYFLDSEPIQNFYFLFFNQAFFIWLGISPSVFAQLGLVWGRCINMASVTALRRESEHLDGGRWQYRL